MMLTPLCPSFGNRLPYVCRRLRHLRHLAAMGSRSGLSGKCLLPCGLLMHHSVLAWPWSALHSVFAPGAGFLARHELLTALLSAITRSRFMVGPCQHPSL